VGQRVKAAIHGSNADPPQPKADSRQPTPDPRNSHVDDIGHFEAEFCPRRDVESPRFSRPAACCRGQFNANCPRESSVAFGGARASEVPATTSARGRKNAAGQNAKKPSAKAICPNRPRQRGTIPSRKARAARSEFWNLPHEARIRVFLEQRVCESAWFSRPAEKGAVTMKVIFGTGIRVSRRCAKNPKKPLAGVVSLGQRGRAPLALLARGYFRQSLRGTSPATAGSTITIATRCPSSKRERRRASCSPRRFVLTLFRGLLIMGIRRQWRDATAACVRRRAFHAWPRTLKSFLCKWRCIHAT
jgi:hypothetical protein